MDQGVGSAHPVGKSLGIGPAVEPLSVGAGRRGEIAVAQFAPRDPAAAFDQRGHARAVGARGRSVDAHGGFAEGGFVQIARDTGQRIDLGAFLPPPDRPHHRVEHRDLRFERVAEQAGDAQGHIDPRPAQPVRRDDLEAGDPAGAFVPHRLCADQHQRERQVLPAGAHRGAAPQVDHQRARPLALFLQMPADQLVGRAPGQHHCGMGRHGARIDGEHVAAGRQHVAPAAGRRAGRTRFDEAAIERIEQRAALRGGAGVEPRLKSGLPRFRRMPL